MSGHMEYSRRHFFTALGQSLVSTAADSMAALRHLVTVEPGEPGGSGGRPSNRMDEWVRPPGALSEAGFLEACTHCVDCQTACPYQSVRRLGDEFGIRAGTPVIIPAESPCYLCEDMPCIAACKTGALLAADRRAVSMGVAKVNVTACYVSQGQPCDYCVTSCPIKPDAIVMPTRGAPRVGSACVGCGVCAYLCPADAISIHRSEEIE